ncbi:MAG: PQQ-binding-like beta-propeller repeat protein, partial [Isosphaeraceae bacterium]
WVADFGLARSDDEGLTATGDLLGTLRYMAPERFGGEYDGRVDIYALGLTLYELLTLQPAFEESDRLKLIEAIKQRKPPRPRSLDPRIPRDLETIVLTAIDRDPRRRYRDADAMAEDLRRFIDGEPIRARPAPAWRRAALWAQRRPAEAGLAGVGVLAALATVGMAVSLWYGDRLRQSLYLQQIATAGLAWRDGNYGRLEQLLDACPEGYRGLWEWRLLKRQCHPERLLLPGHGGGVYRLAYSRDGSRLATASYDGLIRLWDPATGLLLARLSGHTRDVLGVSFSPDGRQLVSADGDGAIYLWDVATARPIRVFSSPGAPTMCTDVKFSPDGTRFATAESRGVVRIWDVKTGASEAIPGDVLGQGEINAVAFDPGGRVLAIGGYYRPIILWDLVDRRMLPSLGEPGDHTETTLGLAFSPVDGRLLASTGTNGTVALWDVASRKSRDLTGHVGDVYGVSFSPDGRRLATASGDPGVKIWDVDTGRELVTLTGHAATVFDVAFSPKGDRLATASQDLTARIWDPDVDSSARVLRGHVKAVNAVAFQPRGGLLASGGEDGTVRLWGAGDGPLVTLPGHDAPVTSLCFSLGGGLLAAGDRRGGVRVWEIPSGRPAGPPLHAGGEVTSLAFYPDGRLATAGVDGLVRTWDIRTGVPGPSYRAHARSVRGLAISPDGAYLATSGEDRTVVLRDAASGRAIGDPLRGHSCWVYAVAFAPESRSLSSAGGPAPGASLSDRLASVSGDGELIIWDVQGRRPPRAIRAHGNFVRALAFHPDGSRLASGGMDRTVKLWDASTGDEVLTLRAHAPVLGVAFSPDGDRLAAGCADGTVRIWDARR